MMGLVGELFGASELLSHSVGMYLSEDDVVPISRLELVSVANECPRIDTYMNIRKLVFPGHLFFGNVYAESTRR